MKTTDLRLIPASQLVSLKRNPQFMTPKQMENLKESMRRDGFVAPILVRPLKGGKFEVISGNHRFMAAVELGIEKIPCVVSDMDDRAAKRLAVNLNTIHGNPNAELLAPFLAEMDESLLAEIHIEDDLMVDLLAFDKELEEKLSRMEAPGKADRESNAHLTHVCQCPKCGKRHIKDAA